MCNVAVSSNAGVTAFDDDSVSLMTAERIGRKALGLTFSWSELLGSTLSSTGPAHSDASIDAKCLRRVMTAFPARSTSVLPASRAHSSFRFSSSSNLVA